MDKRHLKYALLSSHAVLIILLLGLAHWNLLSLTVTHLLALTFLVSLGAFYRPRWALWFFIGLLPLETISLGAQVLPVDLRPYQLLGIILILVTICNIFMRRGRLTFPKWSLFDIGVTLITLGAFVAGLFADNPSEALRQAFIVASYSALYFLMRIYLQQRKNVVMPILFLFLSTVLVACYATLQNVFFLSGSTHNAVMPGRPNASFAEADWLGMFLVFIIALSSFFWLYRKKVATVTQSLLVFFSLTVVHVALILTVARSAWVGYLAVLIAAFFTLCFTNRRDQIGTFITFTIAPLLVGYVLISLTGLSRFDLADRAASAGSGLQEITIACDRDVQCSGKACAIPERITSVEDLKSLGCSHIRLESIEAQTAAGMFVTKTLRPDPNISIRKKIFSASWQTIQSHPFIGIGWGSIGTILGTDDAGTSLNSSMIIFQIWLGSGLLGITGFFLIIFALFRKLYPCIISQADQDFHGGLITLLCGTALLVPNFFNAGMLLGYVWFYLVFAQISWSESKKRVSKSL